MKRSRITSLAPPFLIGKVPFQRVVKEVFDEVSKVFLEGKVPQHRAAKGALD